MNLKTYRQIKTNTLIPPNPQKQTIQIKQTIQATRWKIERR